MDGENGRREEFNFDNSGSSDGLCRIKIHKQKKTYNIYNFFFYSTQSFVGYLFCLLLLLLVDWVLFCGSSHCGLVQFFCFVFCLKYISSK